MESLLDFAVNYGLFLAKVATIVIAIGLVIGWLVNAIHHARSLRQDNLEVRNINERLEHMADTLYGKLLTKRQVKAHRKQRKAEHQRRNKEEKLGKKPADKRPFVRDFDGDSRATAVDSLRDEITAVLQVAEAGDEVLLRLEAAGGVVHGYGLAASQRKRVRDTGMHLTVAVDKVAASGGYRMA